MTLPSYKASSPQIWMRRYFADLLAVVSEQYSLCLAAHHLAVYLLDLFMDRYDVSLHELYASALSCLLLACTSTSCFTHVSVFVLVSVQVCFKGKSWIPGEISE